MIFCLLLERKQLCRTVHHTRKKQKDRQVSVRMFWASNSGECNPPGLTLRKMHWPRDEKATDRDAPKRSFSFPSRQAGFLVVSRCQARGSPAGPAGGRAGAFLPCASFPEASSFSSYPAACETSHMDVCVWREVGIQVHCFFPYSYPVVPTPFVEKTFLSPRAPLSRINRPCMCESVSGLSFLSHWPVLLPFACTTLSSLLLL